MVLIDYWRSVVLVDSGDVDAAAPTIEALMDADTNDPFIAAFPVHPVVQLGSAIIAARRGDSPAAERAFEAGAGTVQPMLERLDTTWFSVDAPSYRLCLVALNHRSNRAPGSRRQ